MKEKRTIQISFFLVGDSQKSKRVFWEVYAWLGVSVKVGTFECHQVGQIWSYRAVIFFPCSKSRDLGPEHGFRACSFKNKGKKSDFHIFGGQKTNKIRGKLNEIGQILVPRALNDTKKIRKAGADIFANVGTEKPWNYPKTGRMQPRRATLHGAPARASLVKFFTTR